jgi:hypothetical protein
MEHAQAGVKAPFVRHVDIDAHDAEHQFFPPGVEAIALVECIARQQDWRGGWTFPVARQHRDCPSSPMVG